MGTQTVKHESKIEKTIPQWLETYKTAEKIAESDPRQALKAYKSCLSLKPDFWPAHFKMGNVLLSLGDAAEATKAYASAAKLNRDSDSWEIWLNLSISLCQENKLSAALKAADRSIELSSTSFQAYINRGLIYTKLNQMETASKDFGIALQYNPSSKEAAYNLGLSLEKQNVLNEALAAYDQALKISPKDAWQIHYSRGMLLSKLSRDKEALAAYSAALQDNPYLDTAKKEITKLEYNLSGKMHIALDKNGTFPSDKKPSAAIIKTPEKITSTTPTISSVC